MVLKKEELLLTSTNKSFSEADRTGKFSAPSNKSFRIKKGFRIWIYTKD